MNRLVERKGDEWHVCRMENSTMRVWVGRYKTEEEAMIAYNVSLEHLAERDAWLETHRQDLQRRIREAIDGKTNKDNA